MAAEFFHPFPVGVSYDRFTTESDWMSAASASEGCDGGSNTHARILSTSPKLAAILLLHSLNPIELEEGTWSGWLKVCEHSSFSLAEYLACSTSSNLPMSS